MALACDLRCLISISLSSNILNASNESESRWGVNEGEKILQIFVEEGKHFEIIFAVLEFPQGGRQTLALLLLLLLL